jgi:hypothetical protein
LEIKSAGVLWSDKYLKGTEMLGIHWCHDNCGGNGAQFMSQVLIFNLIKALDLRVDSQPDAMKIIDSLVFCPIYWK